jgi:DNA repair protein RadC
MTKQIIEVARPLDIAVHDQFIVGPEGHASPRALG